MELVQQRAIELWEEGHPPQKVSLHDLEGNLNFTYLDQLDFKDPVLARKLIEEGLEHSATEESLSNGQKWKNEILSGYLPEISVRFVSPEVSYGLFAEEDIEVGSYVGEYVGQIRKNDDRLFISDYLYSYPLCDEIGRNYVIDAHQGNLVRFINHSYHPNLKASYAYIDGIYHMILTAITPIEKGTQLAYNYGKRYWYVRSTPTEIL